ncbi:S8 family serine peptidase [bacterium]|nr:S8 family serine peptidase [bacterium]
MSRKLLYFFLFLPFLASAKTDWSRVDLDNPERFVQGRITVCFRQGFNLDDAMPLLSSRNVKEVRRISQLNALTLAIPDGSNAGEYLEYYESMPDVLFAEPVAINYVFWTPNDPLFSYQWHYDANHLDMPSAWDKERGSSSVIIAIVDTGIAFEDYAIPSYELYEVSSEDGYYYIAPDLTSTQFVAGYDFIHDDSHPNDQYSHGTHVAGTVAQATNNGKGVAGMAPDCKLMPVQVLSYKGSGPSDAIADGITWAADNGADVINLSLGGDPGDSTGMSIEHQAITYASNKGVVVVAAAGNQAVGEVSYPGGYDECICVAALDYNNSLSYYSQWGPGLDISAPGGDVTVDLNGDELADGVLQCTYLVGGDGNSGAKVDSFAYMFYQGTSMATPHVAGLAALLLSHGITGVQNVKDAIYQTARDLGSSGYDTRYGWGMIDPSAALDYGSGTGNPPQTPSAPTGPSSASAGQSVTFTASTTDPDGDQVAYRFDWGDGNVSAWTSFVSSGVSQSSSHSYTKGGTFYVKAKAKDSNGKESGWSSGSAITITGGAADIAIPVLQNPLLSQYIDIWVVPTTGPLLYAPEVTVTLNADERAVTMESVSASDAYVGDYTFYESGTATIDVTADGQSDSRVFTVSSIASQGGTLFSPDSRVRLEIPEAAVGTKTFFTLIPEKTEQGALSSQYAIPAPKDVKSFGDAYRAGPSQDIPATVSFSYSGYNLSEAEVSSLSIMRYENETWTRVPCFIDRKQSEVVADIKRLGVFMLVTDPATKTPALPEALSLVLESPTEKKLKFSVNEVMPVSLAIFDATGRKVCALYEGISGRGEFSLTWNGMDDKGRLVNQGVYFARLQTPSACKTIKIVSVR